MSDIEFNVKETAGDDHEMHMELKIKGKSNEVKKILKNWLGYD